MVDSSNKVVPLGSSPDELDDSHLFARFPAPFRDVKEQGKRSFQRLLQQMFDNTDDALFELADRAANNAEQNMYFESMREVRIKRRGMEIRCAQEIDKAFHGLIKGENPLQKNDSRGEVSTAKLSLLEHEALEELVAVEGMISKASSRYQLPLKHLSTRLDSLVEKQSVNAKNNPFGPEMICQAFIAVCRPLELDIKAKLVLFKLFDRHVLSGLGSVYDETNRLLIEGGILSKLEQGGSRPSQTPKQTSNVIEQDIFSDLQTLLHDIPQPRVIQLPEQGLTAPGLSPQIPRDTLLQLLQQVQQTQMKVMQREQELSMAGEVPRQLDVQRSLDQLLIRRMPSKSLSIGQVEDDTINLVAMLFQFILDDRNLAAPMKALIGRLQIPIIKVAMQDKSFFSKGGHPARKLLNEIANAALGWVAGEDIHRDPLYNKVESVVSQLLNEFDNDPDIFRQILTDFVSFMEVQGRRAELVAKRAVDAEDGRARSELARSCVDGIIDEKVSGQQLPSVVIELLEKAWSNVLFHCHLKDGEGSSSWLEALDTVDELLWSVQPPENTESRQRLLKRLPSLLKTLRNGLTRTSFDPFEMNKLFAELEIVHLARLKEKPVDAVTSTPGANTLDELLDERSANKPKVARPRREKTPVPAQQKAQRQSPQQPQQQPVAKPNISAKPTPAIPAQAETALDESDSSYGLVDALDIGSWVEVHQQEGNKFRCRLAAIIRVTGRYIFVNRSGMKVAEHTRGTLAQSIKLQQITLLDDSLLFDRALESVIGDLRGMNAKV